MAQRVAYENLIYNEILRFQLVVLRGVNRVLATWATVAIMHPQYVHADIHLANEYLLIPRLAVVFPELLVAKVCVVS